MGRSAQSGIRHITPVAESDLDARLVGLAGYWANKRRGRRYPARADFDPLELKALLGYLLMVDVVRDTEGGMRFRYRLFGTEFVFYHGGDLTGHWLEDIANVGFRDELLALYRGVVTDGQMRTLSYDYLVGDQRRRFQAVLLPLSTDGETVNIVLGCGVPVETPPG
ncbi:MAG: PAS domain-containing protein [Ferrovibrio sp.]|uniref:PAS domain-containing protein n=1 Tax=Ferrovibrio sp. TaxID=1917215 RepID=UPI0026019909|nr:PAS domain-containing protein [Ferrovibrio sp.]MCW0233613.1 PAS domain-containing protein [Ferrovibrio sp.]